MALLAPGSLVPSETVLAGEFGVTRKHGEGRFVPAATFPDSG